MIRRSTSLVRPPRVITSASARSPIFIRCSGASATRREHLVPGQRREVGRGERLLQAPDDRRVGAGRARPRPRRGGRAPVARPLRVARRCRLLAHRHIIADESLPESIVVSSKLFLLRLFLHQLFIERQQLTGRTRDEHQTIKQQIPAGTYVGRSGPLLDRLRRRPQRRLDLPQRLRRLRGAADRRREPEARGHGRRRQHPRSTSEQLKGHLLSPEFFDAERYPQLRFESSELSVAEDGAATVRGELEIGGQSARSRRAARFAPARRDLAGNARVGLSLATTVDRRRLRPRLAGRAAQRRRGARLRGRDRGRAGAGRGGRVAMRVLGISGSLRRDSLNSALLRAAAERLPAGAELVEFERLARGPALRRGRRSGGRRPRRCASCARRSATPTRC